eukprot:1036218-Prymnesium_polylepis.1
MASIADESKGIGADDGGGTDALELNDGHSKSMRHAGKRVWKIGKKCMDHLANVIEEEEKEEAAFKLASATYQATMDGLHNKYALEIQAREDALAAASSEKEQEASQAKAEIKRLQKAITDQQNEAAEELARVQAKAEEAKKNALANMEATLKKKQKAETASLSANSSLDMIIADVMQSLKDKSGALSQAAANPAPAPPVVQKPVASIWIMQKNVNPSYMTVREK